MHLVSLVLLAFAVSLDGFGVGVMYGLRKIRIPLVSLLIIALLSGTVILLAMQIGTWLSGYVSAETARRIGASLLMAIGLWTVYQTLTQREDVEAAEEDRASVAATGSGLSAAPLASPVQGLAEDRSILRVEIKRLGLVVQILLTPSAADADRSGNISASEAGFLGLALSLDAFGAGLGAALLGFAPLLTSAVITTFAALFLASGLQIGLRFADVRWMKRLSLLPGCVLIVMGLLKWM
ncbi:sporulation membrane protein YtaF [Paenibacillus sp. J31TS4]|uniref:MntP/YtaF family protein n=1 Tax=Paenibacillus sp. J31TS4 TaxID=2807195 RepID=UPI001B2DE8F9|nr:MntP/YtaF family protein [Paenibacillus sp. J31TS4]GIP38221.1 sporulation membrane protein YtaF [Paenibacillus sp. J31TS4]